MTTAEILKRKTDALKEADEWKQPFIDLYEDDDVEVPKEYQELLIQQVAAAFMRDGE